MAREPFRLHGKTIVTNPPEFYAALQRDIRLPVGRHGAGPNGPRAAGLVQELKRLRELTKRE